MDILVAEGPIIDIQTEQVGDYNKLVVVIQHDLYAPRHGDPVPGLLAVEFFGKDDQVERLNGAVPGDKVQLQFRMDARQWTDKEGRTKWFPSIRGTACSTLETGPGKAPATAAEGLGLDAGGDEPW